MSEVVVETVKTEETKESEIKYLNINVSNSEVERNPDIVRLCADAGTLEYVKPKTDWIPVSERLPEPYEQVLRTVKSIGWNGTFHTYVDIGSICPIDTNVIAWMPLPEPYKAESEEL